VLRKKGRHGRGRPGSHRHGQERGPSSTREEEGNRRQVASKSLEVAVGKLRRNGWLVGAWHLALNTRTELEAQTSRQTLAPTVTRRTPGENEMPPHNTNTHTACTKDLPHLHPAPPRKRKGLYAGH